MTIDRRFRHYKGNEDRIIPRGELLLRKYYGETGSARYYQILIPKQLVNEVIRTFQGEFGKDPGITRSIIAYREKCYFSNVAQLIRVWVLSREQCLRESRIKNRLTRPPLKNSNAHVTTPENAMQKDLVLELLQSGGYGDIWTTTDVFFRFLFAYPTSNQDAKTITKVVINIMTKLTFLQRILISDKGTTLISDKGTAFMSHVIKKVVGILGITLKHAITKHVQKSGLPEQSDA